MLKAIGLMRGTSLDGVDVALIETEGERIGAFGPIGYRAYADSERDLLRQALADAVSVTRRDARPVDAAAFFDSMSQSYIGQRAMAQRECQAATSDSIKAVAPQTKGTPGKANPGTVN